METMTTVSGCLRCEENPDKNSAFRFNRELVRAAPQ